MKSYKLSFGTINVINNNLAEVIVDYAVVLDEVMVDEYHDFLLTNLEAPFSLLINKTNSYSYTFGAQKIIANLKEIKAMGVYVGTNGGLMSTETLMDLNQGDEWNLKMFMSRDEAYNWLIELP